MGYSSDDSMVRVDFFKESGKWYTTEEMKWDTYSADTSELIHDIFKRCLRQSFEDHFKDMIAVCLEPDYEHAFPLMTRNWHQP